jgi:hypothetical protein
LQAVYKRYLVKDVKKRSDFIPGRFFTMDMVDQCRIGFPFPYLYPNPDAWFCMFFQAFWYLIGKKSRQGKRQDNVCVPNI